MICSIYFEGILVLLALAPLALSLSEEHAYGEDHVHALVVVFVVVVLVRDAVDAFQLVRAPRRYDDLLGIAFAVSLDPREVPYGAEEDLVEDYRVVVAVVELGRLGVLSEPYAKELVDGAAVFFVVASQPVRRAERTLCPLLSMDLQA